ncbi:MAG: DUF308 domain-containing protein [Erysipelotrichaceae bacterium]|nr:DUF308 domain-containing protein [Erysipelotrichaceae bacterium]
MKRFLSPSKKETLLIALMYFLFGLVLCVFSGSILTATIRVLGIMACAFGGYELFTYFNAKQTAVGLSAMVVGIPALIFGFLLAINPNLLLNMFPIFAGIFILIQSLTQLQKALIFKRSGIASWGIDFTVALLMLVVAVFLMFRPSAVIDMIMTITGWVLIVESVILVFQAFNKHNDIIDL